jgi:diadenylate cyclase
MDTVDTYPASPPETIGAGQDSNGDSSDRRPISTSLLRHVGAIAQECGASAVFVYVDALAGLEPDMTSGAFDVIYVTRTAAETESQERAGHHLLHVPEVPLTRLGRIKIAVLLAAHRGMIRKDDTIVFLSGVAGSGTLDTLSVLQVGSEFELFMVPEGTDPLSPRVRPDVLEQVLNIATDLGLEGREGKPVGALFVVGDIERVLSLSRQLILNPFHGYPPERRNILDNALKETVKELAAIDGAFLIREDGAIESAGTYLKVASQSSLDLPPGMGARHQAAAAISDVSEAVSITVSESTGTVTVFRQGKIVIELEQRRARLPRRR